MDHMNQLPLLVVTNVEAAFPLCTTTAKHYARKENDHSSPVSRLMRRPNYFKKV